MLRSIGSPSGRVIGQSPGCTARTVKYIANRPAKNISSLDSQTIVPTLTMLGRVSECTLLDSIRRRRHGSIIPRARRPHLAGSGACSRRSVGVREPVTGA